VDASVQCHSKRRGREVLEALPVKKAVCVGRVTEERGVRDEKRGGGRWRGESRHSEGRSLEGKGLVVAARVKEDRGLRKRGGPEKLVATHSNEARINMEMGKTQKT